jgi:hypothetical protein
MCPFCLASAGLIVASATSAGGMTALAVKLSRRKNDAKDIASTAVMVAGAVSAGRKSAVCIGKFRKFYRANRLGLFQKTKEK